MRRFIENHFGIVLLLSCIGGMVIPGMPRLPGESAIAALALLMFLSCYKIRDGGFGSVRAGHVLRFYLLRYVLLPPALWAAAHLIIPDYAIGVFLLSMVPAGVSSPAIGHIYGGAMAPGFAIVILSQLAAPLLIPAHFTWLSYIDGGATHIIPAPSQLFTTMVWCILLPMAVYWLVHRHKASSDYFYRQNKFFSVLLIAFVIALAVAKQRDIILSDYAGLLAALVITLLCYAIYFAAGWAAARGQAQNIRISYAACSGFNNAALAVSLGLLHFGPQVALFVAVSEISWAMLPTLFKYFLRVYAPAPPRH